MDNIGAPATKYRFDLGGEFTRSDTDTTCAFLGIHTDWVSPDLHLRGERAHDIADSGMRANMASAPTVTPRFWPYARNHAVAAHNSKVNNRTGDITSKMLTGYTPSLQAMMPFGSRRMSFRRLPETRTAHASPPT